jgi:murein DD-endopeptidase MepM/ murein hydrolase activator NlpD
MLQAHLSRIDVAANERIESGQVLGAVGAMDWTTGPHLRFEYRVGGVHRVSAPPPVQPGPPHCALYLRVTISSPAG